MRQVLLQRVTARNFESMDHGIPNTKDLGFRSERRNDVKKWLFRNNS